MIIDLLIGIGWAFYILASAAAFVLILWWLSK